MPSTGQVLFSALGIWEYSGEYNSSVAHNVGKAGVPGCGKTEGSAGRIQTKINEQHNFRE